MPFTRCGRRMWTRGYVFVADAGNSRIQKFGHLPTPARVTTWGQVKAIYH
jgi:hypothetical protein